MSFGASIQAVFGADTGPLAKGSADADGIVSGFAGKAGSALNALGLTIGAGAILGFFKSVIDKGGALQDLSDRLGVSTDELQSFDFAVRQAGGTTEQANMTWDKSRKALDSLAAGQESAVKQFAAIGLGAADFVGLDLPQALEKISKGYSENVESAGAYDAITDILGSKSAPQLNAVLLRLGSEGFGSLNKAAKDAGQVIDKEAIARLDEFGDRADALKGRLTSWGASLFNSVGMVAEGLGMLAAEAVNKFDGIKTAINETDWVATKAVAAIAKIAPAMNESAESAKRRKEISAEQLALDKFLEKSALAQLEPVQRMEALRKEINAHSVVLAASTSDELITIKEKHKLAELSAELTKLAASEQKKFTAATRLSKEEELELVRLTMKAATGLTGEEARRLDILRLQQEQKAIQFEFDQTLKNGTEDLTAQEKTHLKELIKQKDTVDSQIKAKQALIDAAHVHADAEGEVGDELDEQEESLKRLVAARKEEEARGAIGRTGKGYSQQSTTALEGVRDRLNSQLSEISAGSGRAYRDVDQGQDYGGFLVAQLYKGELENVEKELASRKNVAAYAARYGSAAATYKFGDDLAQRALSEISSTAARTTTAVEGIANALKAAGFKTGL
jgi:hypothetical protein